MTVAHLIQCHSNKRQSVEKKLDRESYLPFCFAHESILHLFFSYTAAKYLWSMVGMAVGAQNRPGSFARYFWWMPQHSTVSRNVQIAGLAAICWAIWKARNKACFEKIFHNNPIELIYHSVAFMTY
jgi:hypothetical protein